MAEHRGGETAVPVGERGLGRPCRVHIKGDDYRLVTAMDFEKRIVWIKWIGTHSEYDRIDVKTVAYERPKTDPE
jgi:HigB_toxin, RelE-like toxic component of a toxin-antitoxin system